MTLTLDDAVLACWHFDAEGPSESRIPPDGCCDVILQHRSGAAPILYATGLFQRLHRVRIRPGDRFVGVRLRPGVMVDPRGLSAHRNGVMESLASGRAEFGEVVVRCRRVEEALSAIAEINAPLACVARDLGVSLRTVQRVVNEGSGHTPCWWRRLVRSRCAARDLVIAPALPVADIALAHGFADQAHLTREMRLWFDTTPMTLRADPSLAAAVTQVGYGTPCHAADGCTGEQISIR